jgi:hypothetical protein
MTHTPFGCHNPRVSDQICFRGIVIRLVTGSSRTDIETILDYAVSDTTLRRRRDESINAGVFTELETQARAGYDRIIGLDIDHVANGIPIGWAIDGANRNDVKMLEPTLDAIEASGLLEESGTMSLDRSYDYPKIPRQLHARGLSELDTQKRGTKPEPGEAHKLTLGPRCIVEAANSWWSNYGQLRRLTDRRNRHSHAALQLATAVLIIGRLINWGDRWSPKTSPTG